MRFDLTLYLVSDSTGLSEEEFLRRLEQALRGGVTLLQLREKNRTTLEYYELARKVKKLTDAYGVPLMIDDRVDIALAVDAAGVHVGAEDMPVKEARRLMGPDKIVVQQRSVWILPCRQKQMGLIIWESAQFIRLRQR